MTAAARCDICGDPIRRDNKLGVCKGTGKPECLQERNRRIWRRSHPEQGASFCEVCGDLLHFNNKWGVCTDPERPACAAVRKDRERAAHGRERPRRIAIKAGDSFGRWTAVEDYSLTDKRVLMRCECGTERRIFGTTLLRGGSTSCGCSRRKPRARKPPYLTAGTSIARLTALEDAINGHDYTRFGCECGSEVTTQAISVKRGETRSCGCLRREVHTRHGLHKHPLYGTWANMVDRCTNPRSGGWPRYGGTGIKVCDRWLDIRLFIADIEALLGPRPPGWTLDRWPDNAGNYEPGNVRWADDSMQNSNQRTVVEMNRKLEDALARAEKAEAELAATRPVPAPRKRRMPVTPEITLF